MIYDVVADYYKEKIREDVPDYQIHGWENEAAPLARFKVLTGHVHLKNRTLLDVGCGAGSLVKYLREQGFDGSYMGIDLLPEMLEIAKKRYPEELFMQMDLLEDCPFPEDTFDIVYSSGVFNIACGYNEELLVDYVKVFHTIASKIVVFNLLSNKSPDREKGYYYWNPESIPYILKKAGVKPSEYKIAEGYLPNDFTVIIKK